MPVREKMVGRLRVIFFGCITMNYLRILLFIVIYSCNTSQKPEPSANHNWRINSVDSFFIGARMVFLENLQDSTGDTFRIRCYDSGDTYLSVTLDAPPGITEVKDIIGDSLPEIIIDDCLGCDLGRLRLFSFNTTRHQYFELRGTDSLLSEIFRLDGTGLMYNVACFNTGGCESRLLSVAGDSCIAIAKMYVPYGDSPILLTNILNPSARYIASENLDIDALMPYLWKHRFLNE